MSWSLRGWCCAVATLAVLDGLLPQTSWGQVKPADAFQRGLVLFKRVWQPEPLAEKKGDGLGPMFNSRDRASLATSWAESAAQGHAKPTCNSCGWTTLEPKAK